MRLLPYSINAVRKTRGLTKNQLSSPLVSRLYDSLASVRRIKRRTRRIAVGWSLRKREPVPFTLGTYVCCQPGYEIFFTKRFQRRIMVQQLVKVVIMPSGAAKTVHGPLIRKPAGQA